MTQQSLFETPMAPAMAALLAHLEAKAQRQDETIPYGPKRPLPTMKGQTQ